MATRYKKIDSLENEQVNKTILKKQQKQSKFSCNCISPQLFTLNLMLCICGLIMYYQHIIENLNSPIYSSEKTYSNNIEYKNYKKCHLAILISGQIQRFIFKDEFGVLIENNTNTKTNISCQLPWIIHVFIVLHNGTMAKPWDGNVDPFGPPYMYNTTMQNIHQWYIQRGANKVVIKILTNTHMKTMINILKTVILKNSNISQSDAMKLISTDQRWHSNLRMFYLRHLVFRLTLNMNIKYDMLTYWRDDNYFLSPIDLNNLTTYFQQTHTSIAVDKYCGWFSLSDKIYVTNFKGAKLLFDETFDDFKHKMVEWVQLTHRKMKQNLTDPFQTESFLERVIQKVKYIKIDLHRTELRYINGKLCASPLYVHCTPALRLKHNELICKGKELQTVIDNNVSNNNVR